MVGLPATSASRMGRLIVNPSGDDPGFLETEMRGPAWWLLDMSPLWGVPAERGENDLLPGVAGRAINPKRIDETTYVMAFHITGSVNVTGGAPAVNELAQLYANLAHLRANVCAPDPTIAAFRDAKLILPDASEVSAQVQCRFDVVAQRGADIDAVFRITIPGGQFA